MCLVSIHSKDKTASQNEAILGLWLSGSTQLDENYFIPNSAVFKFNNDGTLVIKNIGKKPDTTSYQFYDSSFAINNRKMDEFAISKDEVMKFRDGKRTFYLKRTKGKTTESLISDYASLLTSTNWQKENEVMSFTGGTNKLISYDNIANTSSEYCYDIEVFEGGVYLSKYGSPNNCVSNKQFLERVVNISNKRLEVLRWENGDFNNVTYRSVKETKYNLSSQTRSFQSCNKYLNKNYPGHRYYAVGTAYRNGLYEIRKNFDKKYVAPETKENGLIRIRFIVNCSGQTGSYEVLELDTDYREKNFDPRITSQILDITKSLDQWTPGSKKGKVVDSYKFLTFKIRNSEIIEIFP